MNLHYIKTWEEKLKNGTKLHTIRTKEVKIGTTLCHIVFPYRKERRCVLENTCTNVQSIEIYPKLRTIKIDNKIINDDAIIKLMTNDGFSNEEDFWKFFKDDYKGYIIHWSDICY